MDADEEIRRAKLAQSDLNMVGEFLDQRRQELFNAFVAQGPSDDMYELKAQAAALTSLEDFLLDLVNSGKLAAKTKEIDQ